MLDRYTLADIVEVTLRKLRRDKASFHLGDVCPLPFGLGETAVAAERPTRRVGNAVGDGSHGCGDC